MNKESLLAPAIHAVPVGDTTFYLRELGAADYLSFLAAQSSAEPSRKFSVAASTMVALSAVDKDGTRLFEDTDAEAIEKTMPMSRLRTLADQALEINGLTDKSRLAVAGNS